MNNGRRFKKCECKNKQKNKNLKYYLVNQLRVMTGYTMTRAILINKTASAIHSLLHCYKCLKKHNTAFSVPV